MVAPQQAISYADRAKLAKASPGKAIPSSNSTAITKSNSNSPTSNPLPANVPASDHKIETPTNGRSTTHRATNPTTNHPTGTRNVDDPQISRTTTPVTNQIRSVPPIPPNIPGTRASNVWANRKEHPNSIQANTPTSSHSVQSSPLPPPYPPLQPSSNPPTQPDIPPVANGSALSPSHPSHPSSQLPINVGQNSSISRSTTQPSTSISPSVPPSKAKQKKKNSQQPQGSSTSQPPQNADLQISLEPPSALPTVVATILPVSHKQPPPQAGPQSVYGKKGSSESEPTPASLVAAELLQGKFHTQDRSHVRGSLPNPQLVKNNHSPKISGAGHKQHSDFSYADGEQPSPSGIAENPPRKRADDVRRDERGQSSGIRSSGGSQRSSIRNSPVPSNNAFPTHPSPRFQANYVHNARSFNTRSPYLSPQNSHPHSPRVQSRIPSQQQSPQLNHSVPTLTPIFQTAGLSNHDEGATPPVLLQPVPKKRLHRPSPSQSSPVTGNVVLPPPAQTDVFMHVFGTITPSEELTDGTGLGLALGSDLGSIQIWDVRPQTEAERILKETGKYGIGVDNPSSNLPQGGGSAAPPYAPAATTINSSNEVFEQPDIRRWEFGSVDRVPSTTPPVFSPQPSILIHPSHHLPLQLSELPYMNEAPQPAIDPGFQNYERSPVTPNTNRYSDDNRRGVYSDGQGRFTNSGGGYSGNGMSRRGGRGVNGRGNFGGRGLNPRGGPAGGGPSYRTTPYAPSSYAPRLSRDGIYDNLGGIGAPPPSAMADYMPAPDQYAQLAAPQIPHDPSQPSPYMTPTTPFGFWVVPPSHPIPGAPYMPPTYGPPYMIPAVPVAPYGQTMAIGPGGYPPVPAPPIPTPISHPPFSLDPMRFYILGQVEYYFSTQNLSQDIFLRKKMDPEGWVDISVVASFNRMRQLTQEYDLVRETMGLSSVLEVFGDKVRLANDVWKQFVLPPPANVAPLPNQHNGAGGELTHLRDNTESSATTIVGSPSPNSTSGPEDLKRVHNEDDAAELGVTPV